MAIGSLQQRTYRSQMRQLARLLDLQASADGDNIVVNRRRDIRPYTSVPVLESSVMSGPEKIRSRGQWSHIVS